MKGGFHGGSKYDARPMQWWEPMAMAGALFGAVIAIGSLLWLVLEAVKVLVQ